MAKVKIELELDEHIALALARFCKRSGWYEYRANASTTAEAYEIESAMSTLQIALINNGFNPR